MIDVYKHVKGTYSVDTPYIKLENTGSRGHEFKLKKERAAKDGCVSFFFLRINTTCNRLPSNLMDAPSINSFKARLDKHWTQCQYSQDLIDLKFSFTGSLFEWPKLQTGN